MAQFLADNLESAGYSDDHLLEVGHRVQHRVGQLEGHVTQCVC